MYVYLYHFPLGARHWMKLEAAPSVAVTPHRCPSWMHRELEGDSEDRSVRHQSETTFQPTASKGTID